MDGAGARPYSHLVGMPLKHFKTGRRACVIGWCDNNGDQYLKLYFADMEPADKNADRSKCYAWRRMSAFVPLDEPLVEEKVFKPYDTEADEYDAKKLLKVSRSQ